MKKARLSPRASHWAGSPTSPGACLTPSKVSRASSLSRKAFVQAADIILQGAVGFAHNRFKIELARRAIVRALEQAAAGTPQSQSVKVVVLGRAMCLSDTNSIGKPVSRIDGPAKVTGRAKYAAEFSAPDLAYGFVVSSAVAKGRIKSIDRSAALAVPGVIEVFAHDNRPSLPSSHEKYTDQVAAPGSPFRPLYDGEILLRDNPWRSSLRRSSKLRALPQVSCDINYETEAADTDLDTQIDKAFEPPEKRAPGLGSAPRGDVDSALSRAPTHIRTEYRTPIEHHNPMECFGTTAVFESDGRLTVYDKTQGAPNCHQYLCNVFGLAEDKVRVLSPYVGGAFGVGLRPNYQLLWRCSPPLASSVSQGHTHPAADLHARLSSADPPDADVGGRGGWTLGCRQA